MTHRVHPYVFRLGETTTWKSRWFNRKKFRANLKEDVLLREWLWKRLAGVHVSSIEIERSLNTLSIFIKTSRPGILIGRGGEGIDKLKKDVAAKIKSIWKWPRAAVAPLGDKREIKLT